jgi:hypothetical protein
MLTIFGTRTITFAISRSLMARCTASDARAAASA